MPLSQEQLDAIRALQRPLAQWFSLESEYLSVKNEFAEGDREAAQSGLDPRRTNP
jgi:hypothetical protein